MVILYLSCVYKLSINNKKGNDVMLKKNSAHIQASAEIRGSAKYPNLHGRVKLVQMTNGVLLTAEVEGLPYDAGKCSNGIFAFHIHSGGSCTGNGEDPFADTDGHYNPNNCPHPYHAGDLPPLFGNKGYAYMSVFTDRFTVKEIVGRTVVIHASYDDFSSQPAGNAGAKIACGVIRM